MVIFSVLVDEIFSIQSIKEGVGLFVWICFTLLWFYTEHQIRCLTIYLIVFSSAVILRRSPNKVLHHSFECICFCHDSMQSIKKGVAPFIWTIFTLTLYYVYHQRRCSTIYLNAFYSAMSQCIASQYVFHHLFKCILCRA